MMGGIYANPQKPEQGTVRRYYSPSKCLLPEFWLHSFCKANSVNDLPFPSASALYLQSFRSVVAELRTIKSILQQPKRIKVGQDKVANHHQE